MNPFPFDGHVTYLCAEAGKGQKGFREDILLLNIAKNFVMLKDGTVRRTPFGEVVLELFQKMNAGAFENPRSLHYYYCEKIDILLPVLEPLREYVSFRYFTKSTPAKRMVQRIEVAMAPPSRYPEGVEGVRETLARMHPQTPILCRYDAGCISAGICGPGRESVVGPFRKIRELCRFSPGH